MVVKPVAPDRETAAGADDAADLGEERVVLEPVEAPARPSADPPTPRRRRSPRRSRDGTRRAAAGVALARWSSLGSTPITRSKCAGQRDRRLPVPGPDVDRQLLGGACAASHANSSGG